jgi:DNA-binding Lrp family transcriptional regulator
MSDNSKKEGTIYLNRKEKIMLNMLLRNGRTFNTHIAKRLKITSQVTGRMRRKLEKEGVIRGYSTKLDLQYLGVKTFALALFNMERCHPVGKAEIS